MNCGEANSVDDFRLSLMALSGVPFLYPREKIAVFRRLADAKAFSRMSRRELEALVGRRLRCPWEPESYLRQAEKNWANLTGGPVGCIFYPDRGYPPQLREIADPPLLLYYRGTVPKHQSPCIGVVGTRHPSRQARQAAYRLGRELGERGLVVVSGLARGIDVEAHEGCVAENGTAVAVLGNGLNWVYPGSSKPLARAILKSGGWLLSELAPDIPPSQHQFPARNRIISGLSRSVVVVQAPERSGALITAAYALDQGRDLFVHKAGFGGAAGRGNQRLYEEGAPVISAVADILRDWGGNGFRRFADTEAEIPMSGDSAGREMARLMELELSGKIRFHNGAYYAHAGRASGREGD